MRLPHENYIRFLITNGLDSEETNEELKEIGLPVCPVDYWDKQYQLLHDFKLPKQVKKFWKNPHKKFPVNFFEYMSAVGLKDAWLFNVGRMPELSTAIDALKDEDISLVVKALLIRKAPADEVSALINGKFSMNLSKKAVTLFEKYFFQVRIMSRESWRKYLSNLPQEEKVILYKGLSGKEMELRADLGLPNKISVSEHYQQLHVQALEKFNRLMNSNDPNADAQALKWAKIAMDSGDRYEKLKLGDASDFGKDLQMEFDYIDTDFPAIGEDSIDQIHDNKEIGTKADNHEPIPLELSDDEE